jgi:outer membrane protein
MWLTGLSLMAQPGAGKLFIGGHLSASTNVSKTKSGSTTEKNGTTNYLSIMPMAGYFLSEKIAVGASLGVGATIYKNPNASPDKVSTVNFVFSPFARYYLISGTGGLFVEASVSTGIGTSKSYYDTVTDTENNLDFSFGVAPGAYYYITPKLALEAKFGWLGFESFVSKPGGDVKDINNNFGLRLTPDSFSFGLTYTL